MREFKTCPCNGCEERWVDPIAKTRCHSSCPKHEAWKKQNEKKRQAYKAESDMIGTMIDHYRALNKYIKHNNKR